MDQTSVITIALLMALAATLYSSVGHGGASAYLAIMALFALAPETMRPTALTLNLIVSGLAVVRYWHAGQINLRLLGMFAVAAVPAAFIGGSIHVPPDIYRPMVGAVLWLAALRLFWQPARLAEREIRGPSPALALPAGGALGLLAGLTGTGGGIFLSPLIILFGWEDTRRTSGIAAGFIFLNSAAGLAGNIASASSLPRELPILGGAVISGALIGTWLGVARLPKRRLLQGLAIVLVVAGAKLIFV